MNDHRSVCPKRWLLVREDVAKCAANLIAICTVVLRQTWQYGVNRRCVPPFFFCSLPPTQGGKGFSTFFFLIHRARGCRKPWCKNRGRGITGRCPSKIFLFSFIKHAVLNGQTAHTKGCLENRCACLSS